jgi:hypothetical protein
VIAAMGSNVLAVLDSVNGSVGVSCRTFLECALITAAAWRHLLEENDPITVFKKKQRRLVSHPRSKSF